MQLQSRRLAYFPSACTLPARYRLWLLACLIWLSWQIDGRIGISSSIFLGGYRRWIEVCCLVWQQVDPCWPSCFFPLVGRWRPRIKKYTIDLNISEIAPLSQIKFGRFYYMGRVTLLQHLY
jgi:hypothetical protein